MRNDSSAADYLATVTQRLKEDGFRITHDVGYKDQIFSCVSRRSRYQAEYYGYAEFFFVFAEFSALDHKAFGEFSSTCYKYACRSKFIPFKYVPFDNAWCFPVAIVQELDANVSEAVRSADPPKIFGGYIMPVICDLGSRQLHYPHGNPMWGQLYHDHFRSIVADKLAP